MENSNIAINTPEYGLLKGEQATVEIIDSIARNRHETVTFLGIFSAEQVKYMVFRVHDRLLFAQIG